jgi:hypothetical protein
VGAPEIADGSIDAVEIGADTFYRVQSAGLEFEDGDSARNGDYAVADESVDCDDGNRPDGGQLISGGAKWADVADSGDEQFVSEIRLNLSTDTVTVRGGNDTGAFRTLIAEAVCLSD